ncbi:MAG: hypothetical protein LBQ21_04970 [Clostridiales Family XIII bacterium]|jgi:hypothetical protein|nr:hypothetical protein [Clostridiales Family XIII bacterium]
MTNDNRRIARSRRGFIAPALLAVIILISGVLSGCDTVNEILPAFAPPPTVESTMTTMQETNEMVTAALKAGEKELTADLVMTEEELKEISERLDPFWGNPTKYRILKEFEDVNLGEDEDATNADVLRIKFDLKLSANYYVYQHIKDSDFEIPEDQTEAAEVAAALPGIIDEIFQGAADSNEGTAYEKTLAVHDWLGYNLDYDETIDQQSAENGIYGAIVNRKTMCQGYAEALQLILLCATDVPVKMVIGEGNNGDGRWVGHAWNLVFMDSNWYQVDATFDDPIGNTAGTVAHTYFGQNDAAMQNDHRWNTQSWPAAGGADFLYYRKAGLYAETLDAFRSIVKSQLDGREPADVEVATCGFAITEENLQFIYKTNIDVDKFYWSQTPIGNTTIIRIEPGY